MGYSTDFDCEFKFDKPLTDKQFDYINKFSSTRRMKRNVQVLMELYKGKNGLPGTSAKKNTEEEIYGPDGAYFVGDFEDSSVIDSNVPPGQPTWKERDDDFERSFKAERKLIDSGKCQPGLWCQWIVEGSDDEQALKWDGGEKFYEYVPWLNYLIANFFEPWGVKLNGEVEWVGDDSSDLGKIVVTDNVVEVFDGSVKYKKKK